MNGDELVIHAREMREQLSGELSNGVGNTIDALADRIQSLTADNAALREALEPIAAVVADYERDGYSDRLNDDEAILGRMQWRSADYPGAEELPPRVTWGQLKAIALLVADRTVLEQTGEKS